MIPASHHGAWTGPNRLWFEGPEPERCDGALEVEPRRLTYTWTFRGEDQRGVIDLHGPPGSLRAEWSDSWHAKEGMTLHGYRAEGVLRLFGTYSAGDGPDWGWRIELETRDPEHLVLRMFNLTPEGEVAPAVHLRGSRG